MCYNSHAGEKKTGKPELASLVKISTNQTLEVKFCNRGLIWGSRFPTLAHTVTEKLFYFKSYSDKCKNTCRRN